MFVVNHKAAGVLPPTISSGSKLCEASALAWFLFGDSFLRGNSKKKKKRKIVAKIKTGFGVKKASTKSPKDAKIPYIHFLLKSTKPKPALTKKPFWPFSRIWIFGQK